MKKSLVAILMTAVFVFSFSNICAAEGEWTGNVNFFLGSKSLDEDDWKPFEEQAEFGIKVDFRKKEWPINIAIDLFGSGAEESNVLLPGDQWEVSTSELAFGVRKIWDNDSTVHPFLGAGIASITAKWEAKWLGSASEEDTGAGLWLDGGVTFLLGNHFNLGLNLRVSSADVTLMNDKINAGGTHAGLLLGYHW